MLQTGTAHSCYAGANDCEPEGTGGIGECVFATACGFGGASSIAECELALLVCGQV
jgi:hypothetical protein